jgi:hypothetical protein
MEQSRYDVLEKVIGSIKDEEAKKDFFIEDDLIVFDNGSAHPGTVDLLCKNFKKNVFTSLVNKGYWSAVMWALDNYERILGRDYEYIYIIESDHFQFALERIAECEDALDTYEHIGGVRTQEYSVVNKHLYDKDIVHKDRRYASSVRHMNCAEKVPVTLERLGETHVYETNFMTALHAVNRLSHLKVVFENLADQEKFQRGEFTEIDFQIEYYTRYPRIGQLDGGVFHAELGFTPQNAKTLSGSWSNNVSQYGYKETRRDRILAYSSFEIVRKS